MLFYIQVLIYLFVFTAMVVAVVANGPVSGLFFYPKPVQQRALELGLTDAATIRRRKRGFFTALLVVVAERGIMTLVYLPVAAVIAKIAVLVGGAA